MKKIFFLTVFFAICVVPVSAFELSDFETQIGNFRYSLYPVIPEDIETDVFLTNKEMNDKCRVFLSENSEMIEQYKSEKLMKCSSEKPDISLYSEENDADSVSELKSIESNINEYRDKLKGSYVYKVLLLNPYSACLFVQSIYRSRIMRSSSMAHFVVVSQIAQPKVFTEKTGDGQWKIYIDEYFTLYEFEYNARDGIPGLIRVYKRKK